MSSNRPARSPVRKGHSQKDIYEDWKNKMIDNATKMDEQIDDNLRNHRLQTYNRPNNISNDKILKDLSYLKNSLHKLNQFEIYNNNKVLKALLDLSEICVTNKNEATANVNRLFPGADEKGNKCIDFIDCISNVTLQYIQDVLTSGPGDPVSPIKKKQKYLRTLYRRCAHILKDCEVSQQNPNKTQTDFFRRLNNVVRSIIEQYGEENSMEIESDDEHFDAYVNQQLNENDKKVIMTQLGGTKKKVKPFDIWKLNTSTTQFLVTCLVVIGMLRYLFYLYFSEYNGQEAMFLQGDHSDVLNSLVSSDLVINENSSADLIKMLQISVPLLLYNEDYIVSVIKVNDYLSNFIDSIKGKNENIIDVKSFFSYKFVELKRLNRLRPNVNSSDALAYIREKHASLTSLSDLEKDDYFIQCFQILQSDDSFIFGESKKMTFFNQKLFKYMYNYTILHGMDMVLYSISFLILIHLYWEIPKTVQTRWFRKYNTVLYSVIPVMVYTISSQHAPILRDLFNVLLAILSPR